METYTTEQINSYCSLPDEIIVQSELIIMRAVSSDQDQTMELPALLSIRQITDYADGVSILVRQQSNDSAVIIIRSMFEISVGLEYLLQDDFSNQSRSR